MSKKTLITCEIKMGTEYTTNVHGATIQEILSKITEYHTMSNFEIEHYNAKGKLKSQLATGWYLNEKNKKVAK